MAKFLTLNTHSWMEEEQETKLNQLVERILQEKYDVICLQEVNQLMESEQVVQAPFYQAVEGAIAIHQDHFALCLVEKLAKAFGGTVAASRAAVDAGWIDHAYQVGQTGTTVKPNIYFACGISGAIQHVAGMQNSGLIVAINTNENAPIFDIADIAIIGDLYKVIPDILEELDV